MSKKKLKYRDYFPNYIVIRRPVSLDDAGPNDHVDKIVEISREVKQLAIQINDLKADMRVFINEQKLDTSNNAQDNKEIKDMLRTVFAYIHKSTGSIGSLEGYIGVGSSR